MSHRILWPVVAALGLGGLILVISQSTAQRPGGGGGGAPGMPGRFVVAHASAHQVLVLDTATGQVYRVPSDDFKKLSDLPRMEPGENFSDEKAAKVRKRDRQPENQDAKEKKDRRPPPKDEGKDEDPNRKRKD